MSTAVCVIVFRTIRMSTFMTWLVIMSLIMMTMMTMCFSIWSMLTSVMLSIRSASPIRTFPFTSTLYFSDFILFKKRKNKPNWKLPATRTRSMCQLAFFVMIRIVATCSPTTVMILTTMTMFVVLFC